jgi:hypothetical protein
MSDTLRIALHELVHAPSLDALRDTYRRFEDDPLTAGERETVAIVFNEITHHWITSP